MFSPGERRLKERREFLQLLVDYLERGKACGHVRADVDGRAFAGTLFAIYFIHLGQWLQTGGAIAPRLRNFLMRTLGARMQTRELDAVIGYRV